MKSPPASAAIRVASSPIACAATFLWTRCASSTIAFISSSDTTRGPVLTITLMQSRAVIEGPLHRPSRIVHRRNLDVLLLHQSLRIVLQFAELPSGRRQG